MIWVIKAKFAHVNNLIVYKTPFNKDENGAALWDTSIEHYCILRGRTCSNGLILMEQIKNLNLC